MTALADIIERSAARDFELTRRLQDEYGVTLPEVLEIVEQVTIAEPLAETGERRAEDGYLAPRNRAGATPSSPTSRSAIRRLFLLGFDEKQIFAMLHPAGITQEQVSEYIMRQHMADEAPRVVELHREGKTPGEIAAVQNMPRSTVYKILAQAGVEPNVKQQRLSDDQKRKIVELRNAGKTQGEIQEELGVSTTQVKNTLRLAAKRGLVQDYGKRGVA